jgi:hypothetical protein
VTIYLELTRRFNAGRLRSILCSGPAVVLLRLAIASKDGDWILREDQECLYHVLGVLESYGATYRFGAPLDLRWLRHGWSSHFEFRHGGLRVRTDFFTRPPRVTPRALAALWLEQEGRDPPFTGPRILLELKKTAREKDWPFVGELARMLEDPREHALCSRSARDLLAQYAKDPTLVNQLRSLRPALAAVDQGLDGLRLALESERFAAMDADTARLQAYISCQNALQSAWPELQARTAGMPLRQAHRAVVECAATCLPTAPPNLPATSS